ncbi:MAG TPA: Rieske 2Fe-2S domain-containing protein, partial [Ramlibacter sp.]|nr:Rieske 2Fe-2S domain-containing protein [Ramlibacter sp.]
MTANPVPSSSASTTSAIARANERLADRATALIANRWYVAGMGRDFSRNLCERTVLGRSLVFYRCNDGKPVALQNRCPHRSFPLVYGKLEGDVLRCGYHGIAFNPTGSCAEIPSQNVIPRTTCVPSYPLAERGPFVWIWMGDPALADESNIPDTSWLSSPEWAYSADYLGFKGGYVSLHENLLDLTHFTYLHPTTLGTPEYARTPFDVEIQSDTVRISRLVAECDVPPIYKHTGIQGKMSRHTISEFRGPAIHHASAVMSDLA